MNEQRQKFGENGVFRIQVHDPVRLLRFVMTDLYCRHREPFADPMYVPQWKPDYEEIAEWLRDNEGKGLLISGSVGNGKTMMIRSVIPFIIHRMYGRVVHYCQATQMASDDEVKRRKWYKNVLDAVDDLGTEDIRTYYGKVEIPFAMLLDEVDQKGGLILASTNMSIEGLKAKYGERTYDRMLRYLKIVTFTGESLRSHPLRYDRLNFDQLAELNERIAEWKAWKMHDHDEVAARLSHEKWQMEEDHWRRERARECGLSLQEWVLTKSRNIDYLASLWQKEYLQGKAFPFEGWLGTHGLLKGLDFDEDWESTAMKVLRDRRSTLVTCVGPSSPTRPPDDGTSATHGTAAARPLTVGYPYGVP